MTPIAPHITAFLRERLTGEHTRAAYAYAFQLLFAFASRRLGVAPSDLQIEHLDAPLVLAFLDHIQHERGNGARTRNAQWHERDKCVVYRERSGKIRYPGRNDQPTPSDCERVEIRSLADMTRFERDYNVTNEAMHYDKGTGRGFESGDRHDGRPVAPPKWAPLRLDD